MKFLPALTAAAVAFGVAASAQAQQTPDPAAATAPGAVTSGAGAALIEIDNEARIVTPFNISADRLEDLDLYNAAGDRIGDVEEVLMTPDGVITAISAEVGGFLGIGEREVLIGLEQLAFDGERLTTRLSEAELESLPEWDD
jgi:hypothetical protein